MAAAPAPAPTPPAPAAAPPQPMPSAPPEPATPHFSQLEEDFFAQADRLQHVEKPDNFEDLFDAADHGKLGWFGIKRGAPATAPKGGNGTATPAGQSAKPAGAGKDGNGRGPNRGSTAAKGGKGGKRRR